MTQQKLFNHMYDEHGLTLLESEMDEIISICRENDQQPLMDDFAKAAMQLVIRNQRPSLGFSIQGDGFEILAKRCYDIAEAMMQERERRMKG